jgi:hypothetical protein
MISKDLPISRWLAINDIFYGLNFASKAPEMRPSTRI